MPPRPYGTHFAQLVDDLVAINQRKARANARILMPIHRPKNLAQLAKALQTAVNAYTRPKHRPAPTAETRQATAAELRQKMDDLIQRGAQAFANKEITSQQLTELEIRWNAAMGQFARENRL